MSAVGIDPEIAQFAEDSRTVALMKLQWLMDDWRGTLGQVEFVDPEDVPGARWFPCSRPTCAPYTHLHFVTDLPEPEVEFCQKHESWQTVVAYGENPGFTGAPIYWWRLACGCTDMDTSEDTLEAVR